MATDLLRALGLDRDDPKVLEAQEDTRALMDLIEDLVSLRHAAGLTQKDVASSMGTTQSAVSDFERLGGDPRFSTLQRYARAVGSCVTAEVEPDSVSDRWVEAIAPTSVAGMLVWGSEGSHGVWFAADQVRSSPPRVVSGDQFAVAS